jgi:hypothetical protein
VTNIPEQPHRRVRIHRDTLVEMNRAVYVARRNSAYGRAVQVLRRLGRSESTEKRAGLYRVAVRLLDDAIRDTRMSQIERNTPLVLFLKLLRESIQTAQALIRNELDIGRDTPDLARALGQSSSTLRLARAFIEKSENDVLESITEMLVFGRTVIRQDTRDRRKEFDQEERRRYRVNMRESRHFYAQLVLREMHEGETE